VNDGLYVVLVVLLVVVVVQEARQIQFHVLLLVDRLGAEEVSTWPWKLG